MRDYIICSVFWLIFTVALYLIGHSACSKKDNKSISHKFAVGYLLYSTIVAIGGLVVQLLNLPWMFFAGYMLLLWLGVAVILVCFYRKKKLASGLSGISEFIRQDWMLILVWLFFIAMLFFYFRSYWYGNHLDDGYYITKVATMPYNESGFRSNYPVGVENAGIDSYVFNTWELEASFYTYFLKVNVTLFLRLFQSAFHYLVFLSIAKLFAEKLMVIVDKNTKLNEPQFILPVTIIFGAYYLYLQDTRLFMVRDMFHFNSGMFLGGSIAKVIGIIILLVFWLDDRKLSLKKILSVIAISIVLISKSSIALPVIVSAALSYTAVCVWCDYGKRGRILCGTGVGLFFVGGILLPAKQRAQDEVYKFVKTVMQSPIVWICIVVFFLSFLLKNTYVNRLNAMMLILGSLMIIPQWNDAFEWLSVYAFVAGRAWSTYIYTFVILNAIYLYLLLKSFWIKKISVIKMLYAGIGALFAGICVYAFANYGGELFLNDNPPVKESYANALEIIIGNHYFAPNVVMDLGDELENLSEETGEKLYVVSPEFSDMNGTLYTLAVTLRTFAPDVVSVSASGRYPVAEGTELEGYEQILYDEFVNSPSEKTADEFFDEMEAYGINCIVTQKGQVQSYMLENGYQLHSTAGDGLYSIWYKESLKLQE